jgi:thiamin-phosphate kinase
MLEVKNLFVCYGVIPVLHDVCISVRENELIALLGPNGAGKSTLLNTIHGMMKPKSGTIQFLGKSIENLPPHKIIAEGIAKVPEGRRLFPYMTVRENLLLGAYPGKAWPSKQKRMAWVMELFGGMREACDEHALSLVGGNLARGSEVTLAVSVTGEVAPGGAITRAGARPGEVVVVTGSLGAAAAGLRLSAGRTPPTEDERAAILRHLRPVARVGEATVLVRHGATAMIDVSDGLALDLSRLCHASEVGARVRLADVPIGPAATLMDALDGGEDYELLATLPDAAAVLAARAELDDGFGVALTEIGVTLEERGLTSVDTAGAVAPLAPEGWDHFA